MSVRVTHEVLERSEAALSARLVLVAIADNASDDGIAWPSQELIARKAGPVSKPMAEKTVRDGIRTLEALGELETRRARRGRSFVNVYRVTVGRIRDVEIDYSRLPFELVSPFSQPADFTGSSLPSNRRISPVQSGAQAADSGRSTGRSGRALGGSSLAGPEPSEEPSAAAAAAAERELAERLVASTLRGLLDEVGAGSRLRQLALAAPERAIAWLQLAKDEADRNPAGFVLTGLERGEWPSARGRLPGPTEFDRCRSWIHQGSALQLEPDDAHRLIDDHPSWEGLGELERQELHAELDQAIADRASAEAAEAAA